MTIVIVMTIVIDGRSLLKYIRVMKKYSDGYHKSIIVRTEESTSSSLIFSIPVTKFQGVNYLRFRFKI